MPHPEINSSLTASRKPWQALGDVMLRWTQPLEPEPELLVEPHDNDNDVDLPVGPMKLNYDLLHEIMRHLEQPPELLPLMHTCHTLYELGVPLLLMDVTYRPEMRPNRLLRHFLLSNPARFSQVIRLTCVRVDLQSYGIDAPPNLFPDFMRLSTSIQYLDLQVVAPRYERPVTLKPDDIAPIAHLPHLRHLRIGGSVSVSQLLWSLTVPLKTIEIDRHENGYVHPDAPILRDPISSIAQLSTSLENFSFVLDATVNDTVIFATGYFFPLVRKLEWVSWHPLDIGALASTFPNLESLSVAFKGTELRQNRSLSPDQMTAFRQNNLQSQNTIRYLQHLSGDILSLWALGIRCHVELLEIPITAQSSSAVSTAQEVLAAIRPRRLRALHSNFVHTCQVENMDSRILFYETIQELELRLTIVDHELAKAASELEGFFRKVNRPGPEHLEHCSIRGLTIQLEMYGNSKLRPENLLEGVSWKKWYIQVDWQSLARHAFDAVPSLREVTLVDPFHSTIMWNRDDITSGEFTTCQELTLPGGAPERSSATVPSVHTPSHCSCEQCSHFEARVESLTSGLLEIPNLPQPL